MLVEVGCGHSTFCECILSSSFGNTALTYGVPYFWLFVIFFFLPQAGFLSHSVPLRHIVQKLSYNSLQSYLHLFIGQSFWLDYTSLVHFSVPISQHQVWPREGPRIRLLAPVLSCMKIELSGLSCTASRLSDLVPRYFCPLKSLCHGSVRGREEACEGISARPHWIPN